MGEKKNVNIISKLFLISLNLPSMFSKVIKYFFAPAGTTSIVNL